MGINLEEFKIFFEKFREMVREDKKEEISKLIYYDLTKSIENEEYFLENYDQIFNERVKTAVMNQDVDQMFRKSSGVMVGRGEVWINLIEGKPGYWIVAINYEK